MNWLDIVLLILLAGSVISAFSKGLTRELVGFVSVVAALLLGNWFYSSVGAHLAPYVSSKAIANLAGFLIVFGAVLLLGSLAGHILNRFMKVAGLSFFDRLLGAVFGLLRGLLISVGVLMAVMAFTPGNKPPQAVVRSRLAPYVMDAARVCAVLAPHELRQGFRESYENLKNTWDLAFRKGLKALPSQEKENK